MMIVKILIDQTAFKEYDDDGDGFVECEGYVYWNGQVV